VLPQPAQSFFVGFLFIFVVIFFFSMHSNLHASLPPVALSVQLQTLHRGDNKYNPGRYCCKQHSWRLPSHSPSSLSSPPPPNNSCNLMLRTMNANETARQSISWSFRSFPQPSKARKVFATPNGSPMRFGEGGFGEGKEVWVKLTKGLAAGHRPHRGSQPR